MVNSQQSLVKNHWLKVLLLTFTLHFGLVAFSQKVSATIDREKILIGEQVELQLKVEDLDRGKVDIVKWFNVPDTFNHLEVVLRFPIDTIKVNDSYTFIQKIRLTSFDSGYWSFPELNILLNNQQSLLALPLGVAVLPVDVSSLQDYHDIKDILEVDVKNDWLVIAAIAAASILVLLGLWWWFFKRKKRIVAKPPRDSSKSPYDWALQQIDALQQKNLLEKKQQKLFYTELVSICRIYSDTQLRVNTSNKTTDEYLLSMKGMVGTEPTQVQYFQLLRLADAVKFAKFIPSKEEDDIAIGSAKNFIETINRFYKHQQ